MKDQRENDLAGRLTAAMSAAGHSQGDCAEELTEELGRRISQSTVSRWTEGVSPQRRSAPAVQAYCDRYLTTASAPAVADELSHKNVGGDPSAGDVFDDVARRATLEPLLGGRQAAFVDCAIQRLGGAQDVYSDNDLRVLAWLSKVLHVDPPFE
jgi:hypothetical protein